MNEQPVIQSECYLCSNPVEFPAELEGQVVECPHCGQRIKLFVDRENPPAPSPPGRKPAWDGGYFAWPWKQRIRILCGLGVIVFALTLTAVPWAPGIEGPGVSAERSPLWNTPANKRLDIGVLLAEWIGLGVIWGGLAFMLRPNPNEPPNKGEGKSSRLQSATVASVVLGFAVMALLLCEYGSQLRQEIQLSTSPAPDDKIASISSDLEDMKAVLVGGQAMFLPGSPTVVHQNVYSLLESIDSHLQNMESSGSPMLRR
jgi:DNA-directed RNA polymerase subunit RPC12/RpoP